MRKLIVAEFITLDGFISKANGEMDFFNDFQIQSNFMEEVQKDWDLLLMGRSTYEMLVHFWPGIPAGADPVADFMNTVKKTVLSSKLQSAPWGTYDKATVLNKPIMENLLQLKKQPGKNIALLGSAVTAQWLLEQGLVDEYNLLVYPILLGQGKPLFKDKDRLQKLDLIESKPLSNGIIQLRYAVKKA